MDLSKLQSAGEALCRPGTKNFIRRMNDMENILELQQICKTFPKLDFILDKISFSLPYGAILGFVGENGAGKTTCNKPDRMT